MKLSGELDYRIRYDVEHDLFHAQNVFNDEYIKPTFIEYVQKLEKENEKLDKQIDTMLEDCKRCTYRKTSDQLTKAKEIIALGLRVCETSSIEYMNLYQKQAEQFLKEIEK